VPRCAMSTRRRSVGKRSGAIHASRRNCSDATRVALRHSSAPSRALLTMEHSTQGSGAPHTGTTIVAVAYSGGVVLGADTRVTTGARTHTAEPCFRVGLQRGRHPRTCSRALVLPRALTTSWGCCLLAGTYISNRTSDKIAALADHVYLCRSGSAADTQAVSDIGGCALCNFAPPSSSNNLAFHLDLRAPVRHFVHQHTMEIGGPLDVRTVANLTMQVRDKL
jgi:Proteasome subunit